jgi:hypothetical protein
MSRIFLFLTFLLLFLVSIPGLTFLNNTSFALDKSSQIKGRVIDAETKSSIEFAQIILYHQSDTLPIQITASDAEGEFTFINLQAGSYRVNVRFMGFRKHTSLPFTLSGTATTFQMEPISLEIESQALGEITVRSNAGKPSYRIDKKTIYVENQLSGAGGTAYDLLHKLPSVTLKPDGQIAIHGNSNLLVYINGKPSSMKGTELLEYTVASEVKKIELITSPSAKYDASGSGGIINLITKKKSLDGFNGNIMVAADHLGGYSSDVLLNYKHNKFSFFTGFDNNKRRNEGDVDYVTNYLSDQTHFTQTGIQKSQRTNTGFRAGLDYLSEQNDKISLSGHSGTFETDNNGDWQTIKTGSPQNTAVRNSTTDRNNRQGNYSGADVTYEHKFKTPGRSVSISALWNTLNFDDQYLNLISDVTGNEQMKQLTLLDKKYNNYQINADYTTPTGKAGNLEIGSQFTFNDERESYQSSLSNPSRSVVVNQGTRFNGMVGAVYGTWQLKIRRFELKAGLRTEYFDRKMKTLYDSYPLYHMDLYPSLNSSFKIDSTQEILLNFTRRTDQLKTIQLDPLLRWYNFYNVMTGNPNLKNEITDKIALDYLVNLHNLTFSSELYFYNTSNKIEVIQSLYHDDIIQNRYENMGSEKTVGIEFNVGWTVNSWFNLYEKLDFIDSRLDVRLDQLAQKRSYRQGYSVTTADFTITPNTLLEADFSYYSPAMTAQSNIDRVFLAGISFRQMFLNKRLTFTLTGRDVLGLYRKVEHVRGTAFDQEMTTRNKFPIRFSLSYKFNSYKRDERRIAKAPPAE